MGPGGLSLRAAGCVDTLESKSGSQVIQRSLLPAEQIYWGGIATFVIGSLFGLVLVGLCGWPVLALGILSVLAGYFYTANPFSLAYIALGEATVFIFMGPVIIMGAYYVQRETFALAPFLMSWPLAKALFVTCVIPPYRSLTYTVRPTYRSVNLG